MLYLIFFSCIPKTLEKNKFAINIVVFLFKKIYVS